MRIEHLPLKELRPYARNARTHSETQVAQIAASIQEFGFNNPILVDSKLGIIAGHGRWEAAEHLGLDKIPVIRLDHLSDSEKRAYIIADNRLALNAGWDEELLALELRGLEEDVDLSLLGFEEGELARFLDEDDAAQIEGGGLGSMADRFIVPPFSVLDARAGYWKERKDRWLSLGIRSEEGRGENLLKFSDTVLQPDPAKRKQLKPNQHLPEDKQKALGAYSAPAGTLDRGAGQGSTGTSIFDPVLCELAYRWFCPPGGKVLDPFAGGSVRGIVAGKLGRAYLGIDLREEQVEANRAQADVLFRGGGGLVSVVVSSKSATQKFNGCEPEYIRDVCHASCCESSVSPTGTIISILDGEVAAMEGKGWRVSDGLLQPREGEKKCPAKTSDHLCGLHGTPDKPAGCVSSPFTLSKKGKLVVRNRYRLLKCFNDGRKLPAYEAFRPSLDFLFGQAEAEALCRHLSQGGGDTTAMMTRERHDLLISKTKTSKAGRMKV